MALSSQMVMALLVAATTQLPTHAGSSDAEECAVPGACLGEAGVEAAEQAEAGALRVELLQKRSVAARTSARSPAEQPLDVGEEEDQVGERNSFWTVTRKTCGGEAGAPSSWLWAGQCQPAKWDRSLSVVYACQDASVSVQVFDNGRCVGDAVTNTTMVRGACSDTPDTDDDDEAVQANYDCACSLGPEHSRFRTGQAC